MNVRSPVPSRDVVRVLSRCGWRASRQHGDHVIMESPVHEAILTVPLSDAVKPDVILKLLDAAGVELEEFDHFSEGPSAPLAPLATRRTPSTAPASLRGLVSR